MSIRVAINGYGRIGRNILRSHYEGEKKHDIEIVAVNDLGDAQTNAHLTQYDTAHGRFPGMVAVEGENLVVNGDKIKVCAERNPAELPWKDLGVDVVLECTGLFTSKAKTQAHLAAGAKKVIISAPGAKDVDATVVYGVNHDVLMRLVAQRVTDKRVLRLIGRYLRAGVIVDGVRQPTPSRRSALTVARQHCAARIGSVLGSPRPPVRPLRR